MTVAVRSFLIAVLCATGVAVTPLIASGAPPLSCNFVTATIAFGSFDVYGGAVSAAGTISGTCPNAAKKTTQPITTLDKGVNSNTYFPRKMSCVGGDCSSGFSSDQLQYNLYKDAAHTLVWGDPALDASTYSVQQPVSCCDSGQTFSSPVFGLIPAAIAGGVNDVAVGMYQDTVTVTMNF